MDPIFSRVYPAWSASLQGGSFQGQFPCQHNGERTVAKNQRKSATPQGGDVSEWEQLGTPGDCRRFLRWVIIEAKDGRVDRQLAAVLGQLGCYVLKTLEAGDLSVRIAKLEQLLIARAGGVPVTAPSTVATHGHASPDEELI